MNRRAQIPRRGIYKRGRFRIASCIGTSWKIAKEPRRFLCRFFVPLSSRRRKGNPLPPPGHRKKYFRRLITAYPQKAAGLLNQNALNMQFVAQVPRRTPLFAMVFPKKPLALRKRAILRKRKTGLFIWDSYFLPKRKYAKIRWGLRQSRLPARSVFNVCHWQTTPLDPRGLLRDTPE